MEAPGPAMIQHLQAISREAPSCTLITSMGERVEVKLLLLVDSESFTFYQVQSFLLAAISPYLASLLSQAGASPCISLPSSSSSLISSFITSLVSGQVFDKEEQLLASLLGIDKQSWKSGRTLDQPGDGHGFET